MVKGVKKLLFNICLIIGVVLISIPLWFNSKSSNAFSLASSFNDINIYVAVAGINYASKDNYLTKAYDLVLRNQNDFGKTYDLVLKMENKKDIDYSKILVGDERVALTSYDYTITDNYYLFYINNNYLEGYTNSTYSITLAYTDYKVSNLYTEFITR